MAPKPAEKTAPVPRQDLPWALAILGNPDAEPVQLPQALTFLAGLSPAQLPQETDTAVQLLTLATPFMCANDANVTAAAIKLVTRLATELRDPMQEALRQPASIQAFWAVLAYFHASFDAYAARLAVITAEAQEPPPPPTAPSPQRKPDSRASKAPPPPPVDPETTLPGPSKFALEGAITALAAVMGTPFASGSAAAEGAAVTVMGRDVAPLLTLLRHHSCRIQVLSLRLIRQLLRCESLAVALAAAGAVGALCRLLTSSMFGAVREESLLALTRLMAAHAPTMHHALEADLPSALLRHILAPATGIPVDPNTPPPEQPPGAPEQQPAGPQQPGAPGSVAGSGPGSAAPSASQVPVSPRQLQGGDKRRPSTPRSDREDQASDHTPPGPPPIDFSRPVASAPEKLQELSVLLLQQLASHHHGACQELLRLGALQLITALLPAPELPELPPPPPGRRRSSSASDTFLAHMVGRGGPVSGAGTGQPPAAAAPRPKDAWQSFLEGPPSLPPPPPAAKLTSHALQASLLLTLSCLLAEPGVQDWLWSVHPTQRQYLQLMFLLRTDEQPKPEPVVPVAAAPPRRNSIAPPPVVPEVPPDPTQPPFPADVRAAALQCLLQLMAHPQWLALGPYLTGLQSTLRDPETWDPKMVAPLAEILQRIMQQRLPPPPRAAAAEAAAAAAATAVTPSRPSGSGGRAAMTPPRPAPLVVPHERPTTAASAVNGLPLEANGMAEAELSSEEAVEALKALAKMVRKQGGAADPRVASVVAAALLVLPDSAIFAPPWPPLPSPPPTPPPPPLPTSQYLWDALGRPVMTDGVKLVHL